MQVTRRVADTASCEGTKAARCVVAARTVRGGGTRASYAHARVAHAPALVALTGTDTTYVPGSSRVQTRGRHVSWEGKRDGGGDEQVHARMRLHFFRAGEAHHAAPAV